MRRLHLAYGLVAYAAFGAAILWAIYFLLPAQLGGRLGALTSVDRGPAAPAGAAFVIDVALLGLFAVQHTVMARGAFKRWLTRLVPAAAERSTFVLAASLVLLLLFWQWRPLPALIWDAGGYVGAALVALYGVGWVVVVASTFMIDHFDLFGLRQSWAGARGAQLPRTRFKTAWLYAWVRHPIMTGFVVAFWAAPRLTVGHALFAVAGTGYILVGIWFEERDLVRAIPEYEGYRRRVGALVPRVGRG